ncbi:unnamed protein product [Triticum turgidum subsp. durum]|uniref:Uncharacterized protein n=1 Tax=Triticum turgidum subsp. durum TaxID=4567 RepID=A0A9R0WZZ0_TRITD|nr:unnamed protein product [Triticum turgidum subsp. durum]
MARQALTNGFLSGFMHVGLALVLLAYLPVAFLCRLVYRLLIRPFAAGEDLRGKVVLITGASSGIGEHLAYEYARKGACVALVARTEIALRAVAKTARELGAPDTLVVPADITNVEEAKRAVEETLAHFGKLNHLVANAGVWSSCFFEEITNVSAFQNVMDLNFWGAVYPTYFALPYLKASRGNIVVTASVAGRVPVARMSFYNASKAAVIRFYETLRAELGPHVRVTILMPGYVVSNLTMGKGVQKDGNVGFDEEARDDKRGAAAGGEDGDAGGGGGGERAAGRQLRDVARVVLAVPHGDVRRAGARRLVLQGLLRLQVKRQGRRHAQQEDPHGRRRQQVLPQEHPLLPAPISHHPNPDRH